MSLLERNLSGQPVRAWCVLKWGRHQGKKDVQTHGPGPPAAAGWRRLLADASLNSPRCPESRCQGLNHQSHLEKEGKEEWREQEKGCGVWGGNNLHQCMALLFLQTWFYHCGVNISELNGYESDGMRSTSKFRETHQHVCLLSPSLLFTVPLSLLHTSTHSSSPPAPLSPFPTFPSGHHQHGHHVIGLW